MTSADRQHQGMTEAPANIRGGNGYLKDEKGRFAPGTAAGPGRTKGKPSPTTLIRQRFDEDPQAVLGPLFEAVRQREAWAVQYVIDRLDGRPKVAVEVNASEEQRETLRQIADALNASRGLRTVGAPYAELPAGGFQELG